jgi:hypothetical protein
MTMQSSGAISMGQAMNECGIGGQTDAANSLLSRLAGVGSGSQYAWSYWYGKSNLATLNGYVAASLAEYVDRNNEILINLQTGSYSPVNTYGDHNPHLEWCYVYPVALLNEYSQVSCVLQRNGGNARVQINILAQPTAANGWTIHLQFDDQNGPTAIGNLPGNLQSNGQNQNGATDGACNVLLTAIP